MSENEIEIHAWDAPRDCEYCGKSFKPNRPQDKDQVYCCSNHRKDFFRYGAKLRIVAAIRRDFDRQFSVFEKRLKALENKVSKSIDQKPKEVVTLQPEITQ